MISPPMHRPRPAWYNQHLAWIANQFSASLSSRKPPNLHLLPGMSSLILEANGINLTPVSGLHFVLHLFDQSTALLTLLGSAQNQQLATVCESVRSHDDCLSYLEGDHLFLNHRVNIKTTEGAEFADWIRNKNDEDWVTVQGLPRLSSD